MTAFEVGINYWPAGTAMRMWRSYTPERIGADFGAIAGAGCGVVRVFLLWQDFQPEPGHVDARALERLVAVADLAAGAGLRIVPTLFTGHMSGANWLPRWATQPGPRGRFPVVVGDAYADVVPRNWFTDGDVARAQERLAREAASALRGHPALWAWDLGNENSNVCVPRTHEQGRAWLHRVNAGLRSGDPACRVTIGLHMEDLEQDRRIGPSEAAEVSDFLCMHGYPLYASWARSTTDPALPAFLAGVTRWLGGRDVFFEEFGMPTRTSGEEDAADVFVAESLDALYETGTLGAMLWCFSDYAADIWDRPPLDIAPHERFFGLWRADGTAKPAARNLARYRGVERRTPEPSMDWIDIDRARFYDAPLANLRHLYGRYSREAVAR
jgi:endo-1,4-beta-mannosidase